jgi:pimeloyl-ACP methyl ester carboxylesterase
VELLLPDGITVFAFDFSGSGHSDGDTISLGFYEKLDVECVVKHLRDSGRVSSIGIWGRSMGAATALLYCHSDPSIACLVLDSAFTSLKHIMHELAAQYGVLPGLHNTRRCCSQPRYAMSRDIRYISRIRLPKVLVSAAIALLRIAIQRRGNFDLHDVAPVKVAGRTFVPALFAHADGDDFIVPQHSRALQAAYAGDSNFISFEGDHNSQVTAACAKTFMFVLTPPRSARSSSTRPLAYSCTALCCRVAQPPRSRRAAPSLQSRRRHLARRVSIYRGPHWHARRLRHVTLMRGAS